MKREFWRQFDFSLFGAVVLLCILGVVMISSSAAGNEELLKLVSRQVVFVVIGLAVTLVVSLIDYHYWATLARPMYLIAVLGLVAIYVIGRARFGSARWLDTGLILIQPSELAKIIMILILADFFARNKDAPKNMRWVIRSFIMAAGVVVWILLQPNLSTSIVIMVIWFALLWFSGLPVKYLLIFVFVGLALIVIAFPLLQDYQQQRVISFLFPDPNASYGDVYNVEQALITIGSGGWLGQGYGLATQVQLRFLKVRHTDFIFAVIAAEFGFVGTVVVILMELFVIFRCLRIARRASDMFGALIAYGFATLLMFQMSVNIGVNLNIIPVTGLTLPFISYGGSSLLSLVLGVGLVESVASHQREAEY
jgi:rod shape determining protein RodA